MFKNASEANEGQGVVQINFLWIFLVTLTVFISVGTMGDRNHSDTDNGQWLLIAPIVEQWYVWHYVDTDNGHLNNWFVTAFEGIVADVKQGKLLRQ